MARIELLLDKLRNYVSSYDLCQPSISASPVGWHIEHLLLVIDAITHRLAQPKKENFKSSFSLRRFIVFTTGNIPKGRAKAPEAVRPKGDITKDSLMQHFIETEKKISGWNTMEGHQYFEHPYFGHLKLKKAIRFLEIHTKHHLKIVEEIVSGVV